VAYLVIQRRGRVVRLHGLEVEREIGDQAWIPLPEGGVSFGRGAEMMDRVDAHLQIEDYMLSRLQAVILISGRGPVLVDLRTPGGTVVRCNTGEPVVVTYGHLLQDGDVINLGALVDFRLALPPD
jgi:hypothetical protein